MDKTDQERKDDADNVLLLQDFLICIECLFAAIMNYFAFPLKDYQGDHKGDTDLWQSLRHAIQVDHPSLSFSFFFSLSLSLISFL